MSTALSIARPNGSHEIVPARDVHREVFALEEVQTMAEMVAKSGLFPGVTNAQTACTLMLLCQAEGLHPMQAMKRYHIIQGRPSMRADAMLSEFVARGGRVKWIKMDAVEARAVWSHATLCAEPLELSITFKELQERGLTAGKDNYKRHPDAMLRARLTAMAVRMIDPGCITGMYAPEELDDVTGEPNTDKPARFVPQNGSDHGRGQYASETQIEAYKKVLNDAAEHINQKWLDKWQARNNGQPHPGVKNLMSVYQLDGHLLKWAVETARLDQGIVPEEAKSRQLAAYVAIVFHRSDAERKALKAEVKKYAADCEERQTGVLLDKYPELRSADDERSDDEPPGGDEDIDPVSVAEPWRDTIEAAIAKSQTPDEDFEAVAGELLDSLVKSKAISRDFETDERFDWDKAGAHLEHYHARDADGFRRAVERAASKLSK